MPRKHAPASAGSFEVRNTREQIDKVEAALMNALAAHAFPDAAKFALRLAVEEALVNAFKHGHKNLPAETPATFSFSVDDSSAQIDVIDKGPGFKPQDVPDCRLEENLDKPSGRGLLLMRAYMTSVEHLGRGNHLRMRFAKPKT